MSLSTVMRPWLLRKLFTDLGQKWLSSPLKSFKRQRSSETLTWSYVSNPGTRPLLGIHMGNMVDRAEDMFGDREAIVSVQQGKRATFSQVKQESEEIASGLLALGLERGDRLGIWAPNTYEWYLTKLAAAKAGLVLVNINPAYRPSELEYCLNKVSIKAIICHEKFRTSDGTYKFGDLYGAGDSCHKTMLADIATRVKFDDPFNIQFTSGTTGLPKAAVLTHHMVINNAYSTGRRAEYDKSHLRICVPVPLFHSFGCVGGVVIGVLFGTTCVLPSEAFDPEACLQAIQDERASSCYGTPTMFVDILNVQRRKPRDVSSLSAGVMAGAPCPQELVMAVMNELNMTDVLVAYGMTETSPVSFMCFPSDSPQVRSSTIGYPGEHIEVKVVDAEGQVVRIGEAGELCVRGYCNFQGYWGDPEKTQETIGGDRWLKTGDLAILQPDGYGKIIGRIKDMIIRGGENIYPAEVENCLLRHPSIIEAQVFGVPDDRMGEEVAVWIRKADDDELNATTLKRWCKGKMAHYKVPRYIMFKEEFPKTVTGKIQKFVMRDITVKELNLK
ncbi:medium-chain acyl-CoA ligase ACSF2, mitochondrial [Cherax quadricarinatus]|uniref:medium-chain acyl-CoA ligase ACSF2, mitochondrial n=1 Tax=Cherax quadricarinatus TaxID=27406 RepID=UPI00387EAFA0